MTSVLLVTKWRTLKNFNQFFGGEFSCVFFMLFSAIFSMESLKNARIMITHVFLKCINIAVSLRSSLNPRPSGLGFKEFPQATANVLKCMNKHV